MNLRHIPLLALLVVCAAGCNPAGSTAQNTEEGTAKVTTDVVKRQDLVGYTFFDGKMVIPATARGEAFSPYDQPIVSVETAVGKHIGKGGTIAKLQIPGAEESAAMAKADMNAAAANLAQQRAATSGPVQEAKQALQDAKDAEKRAEDQAAQGVDTDVDSAKQAVQRAEQALAAAQKDQNESLQPSKADVAAASAALRTAREDAAKGYIVSPISGTVVQVEAKPGMTAKSMQPIAQIIDFDDVRVHGLVPPELKDQVEKGTKVMIVMAGASAKPVDGEVTDVSVVPPKEGETSPGYLATIAFTDPDQLVMPVGAVKKIGVKSGTVEGALVVPAGAVFTKDGKSYVSVKSGNDWVDTEVTTGITDGALVEIKSGLQEGETVRVTEKKSDTSSV